eukprot:SAG11_NODE_1131_length_5749_cov_4.169381_1_plen_369_part_00
MLRANRMIRSGAATGMLTGRRVASARAYAELQHLRALAAARVKTPWLRALSTNAPKGKLWNAPKAKPAASAAAAEGSWWTSPSFWGACGAAAGWGMSGAAMYDIQFTGPEVISMTMTPVMIVYSSLFCWWALIITPQNFALAACHGANIVTQAYQMYRAVNYQLKCGAKQEVTALAIKAGVGAAAAAAMVATSSRMQAAVVAAKVPMVSAFAAAPAGPFTVHFWAPMSKWLISGASFFELNRPTDKISLPQYAALTLTGLFFTRCERAFLCACLPCPAASAREIESRIVSSFPLPFQPLAARRLLRLTLSHCRLVASKTLYWSGRPTTCCARSTSRFSGRRAGTCAGRSMPTTSRPATMTAVSCVRGR